MSTYFPPSLSQNAVTSDKKSQADNWMQTSSQLSNTCSLLGFVNRVRDFFFIPPRMRMELARLIRSDLSNPNLISSDQQEAIHKILRCASGIKAQDRLSVTADLISLCNFSPLAIANATLNEASEDKPDTDQLLVLLKVMVRQINKDDQNNNLNFLIYLSKCNNNPVVLECVCEVAPDIEDDEASKRILHILANNNNKRIKNMAIEFLEEV